MARIKIGIYMTTSHPRTSLEERVNQICTNGYFFFNGTYYNGKCKNIEKVNCAQCENWGCSSLERGYVAISLARKYLDKQKRKNRIYLSIVIGLAVLLFVQTIVIPRTAFSEFLDKFLPNILSTIVEYATSIITGVISTLIAFYITEGRNKAKNKEA